MYRDIEWLWSRAKTMDTNTDVLLLSGGGSKVQEVIWPAIYNGYRSAPGGAG